MPGICGYFILCLEFNSSLSQWVFCFISRNCLEEKQNVSIAWQLSRWIKGEVAEESGHNPSFVKLHFKVSSPIYISFYITCINYFMSLYQTTSSWPDPLKGTFSFPVCTFDKGTAELWGWVCCSPTNNNLLFSFLSLLFILIFVLKNLTNFS